MTFLHIIYSIKVYLLLLVIYNIYIRYPIKKSGDSKIWFIKAFSFDCNLLLMYFKIDLKISLIKDIFLFIASMIIVFFHNLPAMITHYL